MAERAGHAPKKETMAKGQKWIRVEAMTMLIMV